LVAKRDLTLAGRLASTGGVPWCGGSPSPETPKGQRNLLGRQGQRGEAMIKKKQNVLCKGTFMRETFLPLLSFSLSLSFSYSLRCCLPLSLFSLSLLSFFLSFSDFFLFFSFLFNILTDSLFLPHPAAQK
jgi:hypothetical protein